MSIVLSNLQSFTNAANSTEKATYADISLDMTFNPRDLNVSLDQRAIKNALICLMNTRPGENILNPTLGLNLQKELFEPMTEANGYALASKIRAAIANFEPRVTVNTINVFVVPDEQTYQVQIIVFIPALKYTTAFTGIFDQTQFIVTSMEQ